MIEVGKQAPDFELASHLGGTKFTLSHVRRRTPSRLYQGNSSLPLP